MAGILGSLANGAKALTGSSAAGNNFWAGLQNFGKINSAFGDIGGNGQQAALPQQQPWQQQTQPGAQPAVAQPSVSGKMAQESEWDKMVKALMASKQNDLSTWLGR